MRENFIFYIHKEVCDRYSSQVCNDTIFWVSKSVQNSSINTGTAIVIYIQINAIEFQTINLWIHQHVRFCAGLTALRGDEVYDLMMKDYTNRYTEYARVIQEKQRQNISNQHKGYEAVRSFD